MKEKVAIQPKKQSESSSTVENKRFLDTLEAGAGENPIDLMKDKCVYTGWSLL